jgi:hypothetical protein
MGGGSQTSTQKTEYDPAYMAKVNQNYDRALNIADAPFQAYSGQRVATFLARPSSRVRPVCFRRRTIPQRPTRSTARRASSAMLWAPITAFSTSSLATVSAQSDGRASTYDPAQLADVDLSKYMNPFQKTRYRRL